jgi:hypothetical protein
MKQEKPFAVIQVPNLSWPILLQIPSRRFRLFVAADVAGVTTQVLADFALAALNMGMVYFCSWGPDCERLHDIVDEVLIADDLTEQKFSGPGNGDVVVTTWHADETLEEALDFFATSAAPTDGFALDSDFRLVLCVGNSDWVATANMFLKSADFFV